MAEHNGTLKYKDKQGNEYVWYPVTKVQNVIGLTNVLSNKQDALTAGDGVQIQNNVISIDRSGISGSVFTAASLYDFPSVGNSTFLYVDQSRNKIYRWDPDNLKYYVVGSDYDDIEVVNGDF